jgi:hypothetical protein
MEKYYFKVYETGIVQRCEFNHNIFINSNECLLCENNEGNDNEEGWVKCYCYHNYIENKILREKNEMLEQQVLDLLTNKYMEENK